MLTHEITMVCRIGSMDELKTVQVGGEGRKVGHLSVAVNEQRGRTDESDPMWFRVTVWNGLSEALWPHLQVGSRLLVRGKLSFDRATGGPEIYDDKDGFAAAKFEVTATDITMLGDPRPKADEAPAENAPKSKPRRRPGSKTVEAQEPPTEKVPF